MNKKLFIYAIAVAVAASSFAYAQSARSGSATGSQGGQANSSVRLVKHNFNGAQEFLRSILSVEQEILIDTAPTLAQKQAVILEHCTARMWFMNKDQQDYEKFQVYDMDKNMPSPSRWDQVRKAPSMVKDLLNLSADQEAKIVKVLQSQYEDDVRDMTGLKGVEFNQARLKGLQNRLPGVAAVLTPSQKTEFMTIYEKARAAMQRGFDTGKP